MKTVERSRSVIAGPGVLEIIGKLFDGRMSGTGAAVGDDDPGCEADEQSSQDGRDTFEVIHRSRSEANNIDS
jgi:hypothetical protein